MTGTKLSFTPSAPPTNVRSANDLSDLLEDIPYFDRERAQTSPPPNYSHVEKFMKEAVRKAVLKAYDRRESHVSAESILSVRSDHSEGLL